MYKIHITTCNAKPAVSRHLICIKLVDLGVIEIENLTVEQKNKGVGS